MEFDFIAVVVAILLFFSTYVLCRFLTRRETAMERKRAMCSFKACVYCVIAFYMIVFMMLEKEEITIVSVAVFVVSLIEMIANFEEYKDLK